MLVMLGIQCSAEKIFIFISFCTVLVTWIILVTDQSDYGTWLLKQIGNNFKLIGESKEGLMLKYVIVIFS